MKWTLKVRALFCMVLALGTPGCFEDMDMEKGCGPADEDYPDCLPVETEDPSLPASDGEPNNDTSSAGTLVIRQEYRGPLCEGGSGVRIVIGNDNDGDGTLNTEVDGSRCVDVGSVLSGGVGLAFCLDAATCLSWGVEFDLSTGFGINICIGPVACMNLNVDWSDTWGDSRLCWDPGSDASIPSDEIFYEEIICLPPEPCFDDGSCEDELICRNDICVVSIPDDPDNDADVEEGDDASNPEEPQEPEES